MAAESEHLQLPASIVSRADVGRLLREAEAIASFMQQAAIREPGTSVQMPKTSRLLDEICSVNSFNLLHAPDRDQLYKFLQALYLHAPQLHISFNNDPSAIFTGKLMTWIRQNLHQYALLQIGLHPSIGAGCAIRTNNKYFDLSLREKFVKQRELLVNQLRGHAEATQPAAATVVEAPAS